MTRVFEGRAALITGASTGLGKEIAAAYVRAGASIVICARDPATLEAARSELAALAGSDERVIAVPTDISRKDEVTALVAAAIAALPQLDILVNCAGVYGPKGAIEDNDWGQWVDALQTNLFGAVLICRELVPHFKRRGYGKIIQLSGGGATNPMPRLSAYATSKAAVVRFAECLALELASDRIDVNCIAPGALNTRMLDEILEAGPAAVGEGFYQRAVQQKESGGAGLERGAALAVFLGTAASDGITGKLISAIWDPWTELGDHREDLAGDIYTLRRITPADRGKSWGASK
jgi:NAD(P)-dependent dehydrogenase (short-subunit alcohol dehydrogenase family)